MAEQGFTLTSSAFVPDGVIPAGCTCDGQNKSPDLQWIHPPGGPHSYALLVDDPDAPGGMFTHWILFDIPAKTQSIPARAGGIGVAGRNDFQQVGYGGPCPPPNHGYHRYFFRLTALDIESLNLDEGTTRQQIESAIEGHVLGEAQLMGRYQRTPR